MSDDGGKTMQLTSGTVKNMLVPEQREEGVRPSTLLKNEQCCFYIWDFIYWRAKRNDVFGEQTQHRHIIIRPVELSNYRSQLMKSSFKLCSKIKLRWPWTVLNHRSEEQCDFLFVTEPEGISYLVLNLYEDVKRLCSSLLLSPTVNEWVIKSDEQCTV